MKKNLRPIRKPRKKQTINQKHVFKLEDILRVLNTVSILLGVIAFLLSKLPQSFSSKFDGFALSAKPSEDIIAYAVLILILALPIAFAITSVCLELQKPKQIRSYRTKFVKLIKTASWKKTLGYIKTIDWKKIFFIAGLTSVISYGTIQLSSKYPFAFTVATLVFGAIIISFLENIDKISKILISSFIVAVFFVLYIANNIKTPEKEYEFIAYTKIDDPDLKRIEMKHIEFHGEYFSIPVQDGGTKAAPKSAIEYIRIVKMNKNATSPIDDKQTNTDEN